MNHSKKVLLRAARLFWYLAQGYECGAQRARLAAFGDKCYNQAQG